MKIWQTLANRFGYLYDNDNDSLKKEFADFLTLDLTQSYKDPCLLQWKKIKQMQKGDQPRFICLMRLVEGLLSISYSNAPIERAFSQLKLIKNNRRLKLKEENLYSFMILKNITKKMKIKEYDTFLNSKMLKMVKQNIEDNNHRKNELKKEKKLSLKNYIK